MEKEKIFIGVSEIEITPPIGTLLAGGIKPRVSIGIQDPLYVKALYIETENGKKFVYAVMDILCLSREIGDKCVKLASEKINIPEENIVWTTTHTHTGPYTIPLFGEDEKVINKEWLEKLPEKFALAVKKAYISRKKAKMKHVQAFCNNVSHNRRIVLKDKRAINTWNIENINIQTLGSEGPIDPEIEILFFESMEGNPICLMFHFSLHTNANFSQYFSSDYPGIVYMKMKEKFGSDFISLFIPGACANINPIMGYKETGEILSGIMINKIEKEKDFIDKIELGSMKKEVVCSFQKF
jgi:neutral ceramidase